MGMSPSPYDAPHSKLFTITTMVINAALLQPYLNIKPITDFPLSLTSHFTSSCKDFSLLDSIHLESKH